MQMAVSKQVKPAGCGCGTSAALPKSPVYVVGTVGFDFGTEARRDALFAANGGPFITSSDLATYFNTNPWDAASIIWTLSDDQYPIYAIRPTHAYGEDAYAQLAKYLTGADRVSVPGWIAGQARLMNGWVVPVIEPDVQGLRAWSTTTVANQVAAAGGALTVTGPTPVALGNINLTALGTADWAYWGNLAPGTNFEHMLQATPLISNYTPSGAVTQSSAIPGYTFSWTNGTTTPSNTSSPASQAAKITTLGGGFKFTAPADATARVLYVYVNVTNAVGTLTVGLSDGSAPPVTVSTSGAAGPFLFTINYQGVGSGVLTVEWAMTSSLGTPAIVLQAAALQVVPTTTTTSQDTTASDLQTFMNRIYFELRNKGASPQERASNFAATQAYFVSNVLSFAVGRGLNMQNLTVTHSPLCRPGSECWDVTLTFFDPQNVTAAAHKIFRFTIDVSDVKPVMIGPMYRWNSY